MSGGLPSAGSFRRGEINVTQDNTEEFLSRVNAAFMAVDMDALSRCFAVPLVVYTKAGVIVVKDGSDLERVVTRYRHALSASSVVSSSIRIEAQETPANGRLRVLCRTFGYDAEGKAVSTSVVRYFLLQRADRLEVEMIEYVATPLSLEDVEKIVH